MKAEGNETLRICPICGNEYSGHPSVSRADGVTPICPDCGVREALDSIDVPKDEQERILEIIHGVGRIHT